MPPEQISSFQREVDEEYRREQLATFGKRYGIPIAIGVILVLAGAAFFLWQRSAGIAEAERQTVELSTLADDIASGNDDDADARLAALSSQGDGLVAASASFLAAQRALENNDADTAARLYRQIADNGDVPEPHRDLAVLRQALVQFDTAEPAALIAMLEPLMDDGNAFYGNAAELTALAHIRAGETARAAEIFNAIAANETVPSSLRDRARPLATALTIAPAPRAPSTKAPATKAPAAAADADGE